MTKLLPTGLLTLLASAVLLNGAAFASNPPRTPAKATGSTSVIKATAIKPKFTPVVSKGTTTLHVDLIKKGLSPHPSQTIVVAKNATNLVKHDNLYKPYQHPHDHWFGGWCSSWCSGWCGNWCGWWCSTPPSGGWLGTWGSPVEDSVVPDVSIGDAGPIPGPGIEQGPVVNSNPGSAGDPAVDSGALAKPQTTRFLKLKNESGIKLQVFVQFAAEVEDGKTVWLPGEPESDKALTFALDTDQVLFVEADGKRVAAGKVRIWAVSNTGSFLQFRGEDLALVPEVDEAGHHVYMATEVKTFTFVFPAAETK